MESVTRLDDSLTDPKTPLGLIYITMLIYTQALVEAGYITDIQAVASIQETAFKLALDVHLGNVDLKLIDRGTVH